MEIDVKSGKKGHDFERHGRLKKQNERNDERNEKKTKQRAKQIALKNETHCRC